MLVGPGEIRTAYLPIMSRLHIPLMLQAYNLELQNGNDPLFQTYQVRVLPLNYKSVGASGRIRTYATP